MKILLLTPPLTQLNMAYPATAQLTGFLKTRHIEVAQADLGIELIEVLFKKENIRKVFELAGEQKLSRRLRIIQSNADFYIHNAEPIIAFLSGRDRTAALRFSRRNFWPVADKLPSDEDLEWAFGTIGNHDRAVHLCTFFIKDIAKLIQETIDPHFGLIRYAESLCIHLPEFEPLETELSKPLPFTQQLCIDIFSKKIEELNPEFVGFTVPFPGNLLSALRCAQWIKQNRPDIKTVMGGGFVNTELRQMTDTGIFKYMDFLTFDDGELPLLRLLTNGEKVRTLSFENNEIVRHNFDSRENIPFSQWPAPDYSGLLNKSYINMIELTNPMHAVWSNGQWNKMTLAHGCYWGKCAFCDGSLDYIGRFERTTAEALVDQIEQVVAQTGHTGFHFVDEAAPPAMLRKLAEELIRRNVQVSYWTNVRFEKAYNAELCYLLAKSGCVAVAGGLEVASERVLKLINKGITIETASEAMKNLSNAGIMTHAYLMYGFPTQTEAETIDSLENVRRLFENGWMHSAFWHRYAMTIHSPSGINPASVGAKSLQTKPNPFANNEIPFSTQPVTNLEALGEALNLATYNYMNGTGYDIPVKKWFKARK